MPSSKKADEGHPDLDVSQDGREQLDPPLAFEGEGHYADPASGTAWTPQYFLGTAMAMQAAGLAASTLTAGMVRDQALELYRQYLVGLEMLEKDARWEKAQAWVEKSGQAYNLNDPKTVRFEQLVRDGRAPWNAYKMVWPPEPVAAK